MLYSYSPNQLALAAVLGLGIGFQTVSADDYGLWCGKYYQIGAPYPSQPPAGAFPYPDTSSVPLLDFRCVSASNLYIEGDEANDTPSLIIDTNITSDAGQPYYGNDWTQELAIEVYTDKGMLSSGNVKVNQLGQELPFSLANYTTSSTPIDITCKATVGNMTYWSNSTINYLPQNPYGGSVVKIDRRTGGLLVKNASATSYESFIPFGFYDLYNTSATTNNYNDTVNRLYQAKELGFNIAHPVEPAGAPSPYPDWESFMEYLDIAESLGLWVHYSMTSTYTNLTLVQQQVEALRNRTNLLGWYVADEPDGKEAAANATGQACSKINQVDGYHPTSLALNCENYYFADYTAGADIVMVDPYPIALNGGWSKRYGNAVDENFGCAGCDNCRGTFYDIRDRVKSAKDRLRLTGRGRTSPVWIVPQLFTDNGDEFWWRVPTGDEGACNVMLGVNHGIMGSCAWNSAGTTPDLLNNASFVAKQIYQQKPFLLESSYTRTEVCTDQPNCGENNIDVAAWTRTGSDGSQETLVFAVNQQYSPVTFTLPSINGTIKEVLFGNVTGVNNTAQFIMPRTSIAGVVIQQ